jgi:hypothetical protein
LQAVKTMFLKTLKPLVYVKANRPNAAGDQGYAFPLCGKKNHTDAAMESSFTALTSYDFFEIFSLIFRQMNCHAFIIGMASNNCIETYVREH